MRACVVGDTLVAMDGGVQRPIHSLVPGDTVLSRHQETGESGCRKVLQCFESIEETHYVHFTDDGATRQFPIEATADHLFWVIGKGWSETSALVPGDIVQTRGGPSLVVEVVERSGDQAVVFSLKVEEFHTYFVGVRGAWVKDACSFDSSKR